MRKKNTEKKWNKRKFIVGEKNLIRRDNEFRKKYKLLLKKEEKERIERDEKEKRWERKEIKEEEEEMLEKLEKIKSLL